MPLTALAIKNAKHSDTPRKLADEIGLFLLINPNGSNTGASNTASTAKKNCWRSASTVALRFALLAFVRSSELRFIRWNEIGWKRATWPIPGEREAVDGIKHSQRGTKMRTPHVVRLPRQAMAVLEKIKLMTGHGKFVVAGDHNPNKPMPENSINKALRLMGYDTERPRLPGDDLQRIGRIGSMGAGHHRAPNESPETQRRACGVHQQGGVAGPALPDNAMTGLFFGCSTGRGLCTGG